MAFRIFGQSSSEPFVLYQLAVNFIVGVCVAAVLIAVFIDFLEFQRRSGAKGEKKSLVETGTMLLFFLFFYVLIGQRIWVIPIPGFGVRYPLSGIGMVVVVIGCIVNIKGRMILGKNWANQIKIYDDHTLTQTGVYRIVRHPLYASLMWMFYGACLIQLNGSAFLAVTFIFVPMMVYRARQEEDLLLKQFPEYQHYQATTGMFFPKIGCRRVMIIHG